MLSINLGRNWPKAEQNRQNPADFFWIFPNYGKTLAILARHARASAAICN
jgi:hypothetical protein